MNLATEYTEITAITMKSFRVFRVFRGYLRDIGLSQCHSTYNLVRLFPYLNYPVLRMPLAMALMERSSGSSQRSCSDSSSCGFRARASSLIWI